MKKLIISGLFCLLIASSALADDVWVENDTLYANLSIDVGYSENCDTLTSTLFWLKWTPSYSCEPREPIPIGAPVTTATGWPFIHFKILSSDMSCCLMDARLSNSTNFIETNRAIFKVPLDKQINVSDFTILPGSDFSAFTDILWPSPDFIFERDETYVLLLSSQPEEHKCEGLELEKFGNASTFTIPCCKGIRGNVDNDPNDIIDIMDINYMVDYQFRGGPPPDCFNEGDVTEDGLIDVDDLVYLVDYMQNNVPAPGSCDS